MTEREKYNGYGWIKVKRASSDLPVNFCPNTRVVSEEHHIEETNFLIEEIRSLASKIDVKDTTLNFLIEEIRSLTSKIDVKDAALRKYRQQEEQRNQYLSRQARWEADHLPYPETEE